MKRVGRNERLLNGFMAMILTLALVLSGWMGDGTRYVYADEGSDESEVRIAEEGNPVEDPSIVNDDDSNVPVEPEEASPSDAEDMATSVYSVSGLYGFNKLSQAQITSMYNSAMSVAPTKIFETEPSISSPYSLGALNETFLQTGITYLNFYRSIASLGQVTMTDDLIYGTGGAQYGAVLLAAEDNFGHTPPKPADMDDSFYSSGYSATSSSNLSARKGYCVGNSLRSAVRGCMDDKESTGNLTTMGHRRWFLNPTLGKVGFGYARSADNWSYIDMKVFDRSATIDGYDFVSWPASGNFPNEIVDTRTPWSVTLNPTIFNTSSSILNSAVVTITRKSDNKKWTITNASDMSSPTGSDTVNSYFHVNTNGYGVANCLIFHIGSNNVGEDAYVGDYEVVVSGLQDKSGNPAMLDYTVSFFSMGVDTSKAENHIYDSGVITREPTCLQTGTKTYTCSFCGSKKYENLGFGEHKWDSGTVTKAATCTEKGTKTFECTLCYKKKTEEIKATGHTAVTDKAVAATCTTDGKTAGSHCSKCGTIITAQQTVKATGHTAVTDKAVAATCTTDGKTAGSHCSKCGTIITAQQTVKATGHIWDDGKITKQATATETGVMTYTCTTCKTTRTETIPKLNDDKVAGVAYTTHVQSIGWQDQVRDGQLAGTVGDGKRLEAIKISLENAPYSGGIEYRTHVQTYGWQDYVKNGALSGTSGEAKRLEAIQIRLTGEMAKYYDVYYRIQVQTFGWLGWAKNGEYAGSAGYAKRLESIQIVLVKKGDSLDKTALNKLANITSSTKVTDSTPYVAKAPSVEYQTHVQTYGWQGLKINGEMSGTSGQAKRLEGIKINLSKPPYEGGIRYKTHVQTYGWQKWKYDGDMSGTSGEAKRLEAISIELTGEMAEHYDVYYRVHAQTYGWLGWAKNGQNSGTAGMAKRLEGIQIVIVEKGQAAPGATYKGITANRSEAYIEK